MNDRIKEVMLVLEHHRALFRYKNAQNERERAVFKEQVKTAEENLRAYEEGLNGKGVQGNKKTDELMKQIGAIKLKGFSLRYIYFIDKSKEKDLTVPILPFSKIAEMGACMYKGKAYTK